MKVIVAEEAGYIPAKGKLQSTMFEADPQPRRLNYLVSLMCLFIHLLLMGVFYNQWANYNYFMVSNSIQLTYMFIVISKLGDESYDAYINRYWWVIWVLGVLNVLFFISGFGMGVLMFIGSDGLMQYLAKSIMTFECASRIPLLICVVTSAICEEKKGFYTWEKYAN
eukprot:NODE_5360_length_582_cov_78.529081_g4647_i0.p1 GENE.NODE_5360_length_582_cov_78.529081_g4647_i0~~NODE_5360_length_582_cov_78.529081_g4647_i0.p1  ORF type:complete len:178 (+),score=39.76 NODE_5360_length_582_cov_78.529081_g4647_i0:35-535(+)